MTPKLLAVTPTMTTVEIALLTGKAHKHVMRDTRQMLVELRGEANLSTFEASYTDERNRTKPAYALPYRETMILVSGYNIQMRAKIIDRWQELEQAAKAPALDLNNPTSLRAALLGYTEKVLELEATVAEQAPKVEGFDRIADSAGALLQGCYSKVINKESGAAMDKTPTEHAHINNFAIRCFRDTGDGDYIAARMAFRARLFQQFLWSAEQAIEKYLKCILMLSRQQADGRRKVPDDERKVADFGHDIALGLHRINRRLPFEIVLAPKEQDIFDRIAQQDADRYLVVSFFIEGTDLPWFDALIWKLRQYCQPLDTEDIYSPPRPEVLNQSIQTIERLLAEKRPSAPECALEGGFLENVRSKKDHPAREHLLWRNLYFTTRRRNTIKVAAGFAGTNSPFWLKPELLEEVGKYMHVPKPYIQAYREHAARVVEERASG